MFLPRTSTRDFLTSTSFFLEQQWSEQGLSFEERCTKRKEEAQPLLNAYFSWVKTLNPQAMGKSLLGKALTYSLNQEANLRHYLLDGRLEPSNNRAERSIKPFVIGRKNFLFCNAPSGA